jgi:hypothetical protein
MPDRGRAGENRTGERHAPLAVAAMCALAALAIGFRACGNHLPAFDAIGCKVALMTDATDHAIDGPSLAEARVLQPSCEDLLTRA